MNSNAFIAHSGVKGMRWGVRNGPPYPISGPGKLLRKMQAFKYKEFDRLMTPDEVARSKEGSCHDQVMYELRELRKMGLDPKAKFTIDVDKDGQGYQTHSFVYFKTGSGEVKWLENAWEDQRGLHSYPDYKSMIRDIRKRMKTPKGIHTYIGNFDDTKIHPGDTLQDIVDKCF